MRERPDRDDLASNWELFETKICDLTTEAYLRSTASDLVSERCAEMRDREVMELKSKLLFPLPGPADASVGTNLKIALSNHALARRAGSELWTHDVARHLARCGMEVLVYSPELGPVGDMTSSSGSIEVTSALVDVLDFEADILHINHYRAVQMLADSIERTSTSIVNMCHGLLPRLGLPMPGKVDQYCAASIVSKTKIWLLTGCSWDSVPIVPNFFDGRLYRRSSSQCRSRSALVYSSRTTHHHAVALKASLAKIGYALDAAGQPDSRIAAPEHLLHQYELVFAVGRSAIEALASGCRVILWDHGVLGPIVTPHNFWNCVTANFALASRLLPFCFIDEARAEDWLDRELSSATEADAGQVCELARRHLSLDNIGAHLLELYRRVAALPSSADRLRGVTSHIAAGR